MQRHQCQTGDQCQGTTRAPVSLLPRSRTWLPSHPQWSPGDEPVEPLPLHEQIQNLILGTGPQWPTPGLSCRSLSGPQIAELTAIRASSCVNLSSFLSASSRSVLPANHRRNFTIHSSGRIHRYPIRNSLPDPRLSSFVAIPKIVRTSAIIAVIISVIATVGIISA